MKTIKLDELQPDPVAAALLGSDKETVTVSGYICATDEATISVCETRDGISYIEYPRSAVIAAFTEEESEQVTLLVDANARVRVISAAPAGSLYAQTSRIKNNNTGCGTNCESSDKTAKCCCGVGERCKSGSTTCVCEDASNPFSTNSSGFLTSMRQFDGHQPNLAAHTNSGALSGLLPYGCRTERGWCPIVCKAYVIGGRIVWDCYCDCTHPIPNQTAIS